MHTHGHTHTHTGSHRSLFHKLYPNTHHHHCSMVVVVCRCRCRRRFRRRHHYHHIGIDTHSHRYRGFVTLCCTERVFRCSLGFLVEKLVLRGVYQIAWRSAVCIVLDAGSMSLGHFRIYIQIYIASREKLQKKTPKLIKWMYKTKKDLQITDFQSKQWSSRKFAKSNFSYYHRWDLVFVFIS